MLELGSRMKDGALGGKFTNALTFRLLVCTESCSVVFTATVGCDSVLGSVPSALISFFGE